MEEEEGEEGDEVFEEGEEEGKEILSVLLRSMASSCTLTVVGVTGAEQVEVGGKVKVLPTSFGSTFVSSKEDADRRCLFCCSCRCCMAASCCRYRCCPK